MAFDASAPAQPVLTGSRMVIIPTDAPDHDGRVGAILDKLCGPPRVRLTEAENRAQVTSALGQGFADFMAQRYPRCGWAK